MTVDRVENWESAGEENCRREEAIDIGRACLRAGEIRVGRNEVCKPLLTNRQHWPAALLGARSESMLRTSLYHEHAATCELHRALTLSDRATFLQKRSFTESVVLLRLVV